MVSHKKSEVSQMFMYLTAAVIIGFTLLFAGKAILSLLSNVDTVESQKFKSDFEKSINDVSSKYGAVQFKTLYGLKEFSVICVVDLDVAQTYSSLPPDLAKYSLIRGDLQDKTANVFLITDNVKEKFLNTKLRIEGNGYACQTIGNSGEVQIKLEGFGKYARFSFVS